MTHGYGVIPGAAGVNNDAWVAWIKQAIGEYREVQPYFYGDFYPLLPYSRGEETWTAWQWNRPEDKDGLVIVLRRPKSPFTAMELDLQHLNPNASYEVEIRTTYDKAPVKGDERQRSGPSANSTSRRTEFHASLLSAEIDLLAERIRHPWK